MPEETPKEKPKSFWKPEKIKNFLGRKNLKNFCRRYEFLIISIVTLLLIYGFVVFNQKINFLLGNELIIYLAP